MTFNEQISELDKHIRSLFQRAKEDEQINQTIRMLLRAALFAWLEEDLVQTSGEPRPADCINRVISDYYDVFIPSFVKPILIEWERGVYNDYKILLKEHGVHDEDDSL